MKKTFILSAFAALGIFASCNTLQPEVLVSPDLTGAEVFLTVNDALWTGGTKTAYTPGAGVGLTGDEMFSLYYKTDETHYDGNVKATPAGTSGQYSFTIPEGAGGQTHWYGLMPYSSQLFAFNSQKTAVSLRLGPVQFPQANSFDPMCDFLAAEPFDINGTSAEITSFKRLFAPLCVSVTGLDAADKIYTATLSLSQAPASNNALAGVAFVHLDDTYEGTTADIGESAAGNAVSAEYAAGLEAVAGSWPVWLMVRPITIEAGGTITLSVSTADKTYTRTVTLPSEQLISTEKLNRISFNIKGFGCTELASVTQDFTAQTLTGNKTLSASDGSSLTWSSSITKTFTSDANDNGSGIAGAMYAHADFTFPTIPGKNIVGARIFCHPASRYGGGESASKFTLEGVEYNYNLANFTDKGMCFKGGALDIELPAGKTSLSGLTVTPTTQQNLISAITLFTEDAAIAPVNPNDYYALYEAGQDITINGTVFNKATNGPARCLKLYEMANGNALVANYATDGILFLDYDEADGLEDKLALQFRLQPQGVVIIGRYRDHQPHIDLASLAKVGIESKGSEIHLKNVALTMGNVFNTANLAEESAHLDLNIEDCTINANNDNLFFENNASKGFRNIVINNSVIRITKCLYTVRSGSITSGSNLSIAKFWMTNSVVYSAAPLESATVNLVNWGTPSLDLKFEHDTFFNLAKNNNGIVSFTSIAKLNVNYCVGEVPLARNSGVVIVKAALDPQISDSTVSNNYFNDSTGSFRWRFGFSALTNSGVTAGGNTFPNQSNETPFTSTDTATGYFPINTTVVTNGAGASYNTKYWGPWI